MFSTSRTMLVILAFTLVFGCVEDNTYPSQKTEVIFDSYGVDLDQDGIMDYEVYTYDPVTIKEAGMKVQRQITVSAVTSAAYTEYMPNLTDVDLYIAAESLEEFSDERLQDDSTCSRNIGLLNVVCSDIGTCSKLCSRSAKCKDIAEDYEEVLGGSMISYVEDTNEMRTTTVDVRRMILELRLASDEERNVFLGKTRELIANIASVNANPIYTRPELSLCEPDDFGVPHLIEGVKAVGNYSTQVDSYKYRVSFSVKPTTKVDNTVLGKRTVGVGIKDRIPTTVLADPQYVYSIQDFISSKEGDNALIEWSSSSPSEEGYLFEYEFTSTASPDIIVNSLRTPEASSKTFDLGGLSTTNTLSNTLGGIIGNYYMGLGLAIGITFAVLIFIYNVLVLVFTMANEKMAGATFTTGFRKAFGRTDVRWKGDTIVGAVFLAIAFYLCYFVAVSPSTPPPIIESIAFMIKNPAGLAGMGLGALGILMVYLAAENFGKIAMLERAYGMVIKQEKDMYLAKVATVKNKIEELDLLLKKCMEEKLEVGKEYDLLAASKSLDMAKLSKEMTARNKVIIDDNLGRLENAIRSLSTKKKMAAENWPKWREAIRKVLEEQNEVHTASLVTVSPSLRAWALEQYAAEVGEGLVFENNTLKRKKISSGNIVLHMVESGLVNGIVVMRNDKVETAAFEGKSGTVTKALALKLRSYLKTLAKKLGQHEPQNFVALGGRNVIVYMKGRTTESLLLMRKENFNKAIEQWKAKLKLIESAHG